MQTDLIDLFNFAEDAAAPPASLPPTSVEAAEATFVATMGAIPAMPLADAKHAFRHRMALAGYSGLITTPTGAWDEAAARRACNALLSRPASDRPEPTIEDWTTAARSLRDRTDAGFVKVPALEALPQKGVAAP